MSGDVRWVVDSADLTTDAKKYGMSSSYRFHASGRFTFKSGTWHWSIPDLRSADYDTSNVQWGPGAAEMHAALEARQDQIDDAVNGRR